MTPKTGETEGDFEIIVYPTKTYALDMYKNRIIGFTDGIAAMRQAVYKILMTNRFEHIIYSYNYGAELNKIMDSLYVYSLVEQYITDALMQDERITAVYDFNFKRTKNSFNGNCLSVSFNVDTTQGSFGIQKEVEIYV